jgi:hypothetical protein
MLTLICFLQSLQGLFHMQGQHTSLIFRSRHFKQKKTKTAASMFAGQMVHYYRNYFQWRPILSQEARSRTTSRDTSKMPRQMGYPQKSIFGSSWSYKSLWIVQLDWVGEQDYSPLFLPKCHDIYGELDHFELVSFWYRTKSRSRYMYGELRYIYSIPFFLSPSFSLFS